MSWHPTSIVRIHPGLALGLLLAALPGTGIYADSTPPSAAGPTTTDCAGTTGNTCRVADADFVLTVTPAVDEPGGSGVRADGYQICRSGDTTGWGGCEATITFDGETTWTVTGSHRPAPGQRRAYYFRARDNAGNWGRWNQPRYIQTLAPDSTPPSQPGPATTVCDSISGNTCWVPDADFELVVTPAVDEPGGSGIDPDGYRVCRSHDTTGFGGCDHTMTLDATTRFVVTGADRPAPGQRRAYRFRGRDLAGNWGGWNAPFYVQTLESEPDVTPPSRPGPTVSLNCLSMVGDTCIVADADFELTVTPAVDEPGGSGVDFSGYRVCRSRDTDGYGGCEVDITRDGTTRVLITGSHRPSPGQRRAYYFRARDNAGNWGPWNIRLYVQTEASPICLDEFYSSIQQGNSNRTDAAVEPNPFRPPNSLDHYRQFVRREGLGAVKIWDEQHGVASLEFEDVISDPTLDVIVYRPMYHFNKT
ncbi:MAG: hypothetical protein AAF560_23280, partial [Acidobacteriota bacterium]